VRLILAALLPLAAVGMACAPTAAAGCNDSSGTTVCAQGDIRGTHAPPPARTPVVAIDGSFCSGGFCYGNFPGFTFGP
jgi:hypothetical protein